MRASQIEEGVVELDLVAISLFAEPCHWQFCRGSAQLDLVAVALDLPGRQIGIFSGGRPPAHLAVDAHIPFRAQGLRQLEGLAVGIGYDLREAIVIPQIYE